MQLSPQELESHGFVVDEVLDHKGIVEFVRKYLKVRTRVYYWFNGLNLAFLGLTSFFFFRGMEEATYSWESQLLAMSIGIALTLLLVPLHEYLHVLAYRSQGAVNTSYGMNLKKFYFLALADGFVADRKEFQVVALTPFVVISTLLVIVLFLVPSDWQLSVSTILLFHAGMCSGDFGLLNYFEIHKDKEVVTYDDVATGLSYFYFRLATS